MRERHHPVADAPAGHAVAQGIDDTGAFKIRDLVELLREAHAKAAAAQAEIDALKTQVADLAKKLEEAKKEKEPTPSEPPQP